MLFRLNVLKSKIIFYLKVYLANNIDNKYLL